MRCLDIGAKDMRLDGFETLDIIKRDNIDYVCDASKSLPFEDNTFDLIHASHILEHISWIQSEAALKEWVRILKFGGRLEVWVPNALKIARAFILAEQGDFSGFPDNKAPLNDPCEWYSQKTFPGGVHKAGFSPRYLIELFRRCELKKIREMKLSEARIKIYGWVNLGITGIK